MSANEPKTIIQKLDALPDKVKANPGFAQDLSYKAAAAILDVVRKPGGDWEKYMAVIVGPGGKLQLQRLMLADTHGGIEIVRRSCAYIVGNAVCGIETTTATARQVDRIEIDKDLLPEPYEA